MADNVISTESISYEGLLNSYKEFLKQQDKFSDYDFTGSNIGQLIRIMAQNGYQIGHYHNMVASEAYLDSAELRESVVSRAKELNYLPRSKTSARAVVDILLNGAASDTQIIIPKNYRFTSSINNKTTTFLVKENTVAVYENGSYKARDVEICEGTIITEYFVIASSNEASFYEYFSNLVLRSENVDISSIEVYVKQAGEIDFTFYTLADSLYGLQPIDEIYFVQGYGATQYEVVFGDGLFGKGLVSGTEVKIVYRDTLGAECNGIYSFTKTSAIQTYSNITATATQAAYGGSERESIASIKFNAPRHFETQQRAVIDSDFATLVKKNFPEIAVVTAYGGELIKEYGKIVLSLKPAGSGSTTIPTNLKSRIKKFLLTKTITTEPLIIDPDYFYLAFDSTVKYDYNLVTTNTSTVKSAVATNIKNLENTLFNSFGVNVRGSKISSVIDNTDKSITGNDTVISIIKRLYPNVNQANPFDIDFGNPLFSFPTTVEYIPTHPTAINSNFFTIVDDNGADLLVYIRDNGLGNLGLYFYQDAEHPAIKIKANIGTVNYKTGVLTLNIKPKSYDSSIEIKASFASSDIDISLNKFALIDSKDITINMVADTK